MNLKHLKILVAVTAAVMFTNVLAIASETDERIVSSAKQSYVFKTYLKDDSIKISSQEGAVTLTGTVSEEARKSLAEETVANLPGVKSVDNRIEIKSGEAPEKSDLWISMKVKSALLYHRSVSGFGTDVDVKDGIVTLRGEAGSTAQKELTTQYAQDIDGVKSVNNEMTIAEPPQADKPTVGEYIDDASITAQVKSALLLHRSTSMLKTGVETKDGVVTLTGEAKNQAEQDLVTKLVGDIKGVKSVNNNMTIVQEDVESE